MNLQQKKIAEIIKDSEALGVNDWCKGVNDARKRITQKLSELFEEEDKLIDDWCKQHEKERHSIPFIRTQFLKTAGVEG